ncbi:MAG: protease modulator HflC [Myxococcota bacterium]
MRRLILFVLILAALGVGAIAAGNLGFGPVIITREDEQKMILRLGQYRDTTTPGIGWHWPFLETVERYDRRWLYLSTAPASIQTKDGEELVVDNYVVWRIGDPRKFREAFGFPNGETTAADRIDRVVRDDVREVIGRHTLIEVLNDQRVAIMTDIASKTKESLAEYGIAVADVRINRTELPGGTEKSVYERMKTERERLAKRNRAEGSENARSIRAEAERDARVIVANARRDAEIIRGEGDAEATRIYAEAYGTDPDFYAFTRSLDAYAKTIGDDTTLVLSPESEFFRFFEDSSPDGN